MSLFQNPARGFSRDCPDREQASPQPAGSPPQRIRGAPEVQGQARCRFPSLDGGPESLWLLSIAILIKYPYSFNAACRPDKCRDMSLPTSGASSIISTSTPIFWLHSTKSSRAFMKNWTISWSTATTPATSTRFSNRSPHGLMTQRSRPPTRLPAIRSTSLNQRFLCHFQSSLQHSCPFHLRMVAWFFPCSFSAPALALACKRGGWIHQLPQGGSSVFILKQYFNSYMLLSFRIHSRHVFLDPLTIFLRITQFCCTSFHVLCTK